MEKAARKMKEWEKVERMEWGEKIGKNGEGRNRKGRD